MKILPSIVFLLLLTVSCSSKTKVENLAKNSFLSPQTVNLTFNSSIIKHIDYKLDKPIHITFETNSQKITPLAINDTLTLGVEIAMRDISLRDYKDILVIVYYYEKDENDQWIPLVKLDPEEYYYGFDVGSSSDYDSKEVYIAINQKVTILPRKNELRNPKKFKTALDYLYQSTAQKNTNE